MRIPRNTNTVDEPSVLWAATGMPNISMLWPEIQPLAESLVPLETGNRLDSVAGVLFPVDPVPMQQGLLMH